MGAAPLAKADKSQTKAETRFINSPTRLSAIYDIDQVKSCGCSVFCKQKAESSLSVFLC